MIYCRQCGEEVQDNAMACPSCGVRPNDGNAFCQACGAETWSKAVMCVTCGAELASLNQSTVSIGSAGTGAPNEAPVSLATALLWWLCCLPIGFAHWGQVGKGFVWSIIALFTGGVGGFIAWIDYAMCFIVQQKRKLGEWEFFPTA